MGRRSTSAYETHSGTPRLRSQCPKAMAALLRWLGLDGRSREAATRRLLLLWRRMRRRAAAAPWSELPPELLGLVLSRLPSQADRVHLRAVCRTWCSAARLQPLPPPLPLLVLRDNTLLALPNGTLHRLPLDWDGIHIRISTGGTLFLNDSFRGCYFVDPFSRSGETTPQRINIYNPHSMNYRPDVCHRWIRKVVVSHHIVAVLHEAKVHFFPRGDERSCSTMVWAPPVITHLAVDIALFQGKHYILVNTKYFDGDSELPELHLLDIINHSVRSVQCIQGMPRNYPGLPANTGRSFYYLVVSGDRLLMVELQTDVEVRSYSEGPSRHIRTQFEFEVSEWVDQIGCHGRWSKVDTLMGRTLFISPHCSRSLPAQSGARADCIYYVCEWMSNHQDENLDCIVYNVKDKVMEPLASEMKAAMKVRNHGLWNPTWLFPADV